MAVAQHAWSLDQVDIDSSRMSTPDQNQAPACCGSTLMVDRMPGQRSQQPLTCSFLDRRLLDSLSTGMHGRRLCLGEEVSNRRIFPFLCLAVTKLLPRH